MSQVTIQQAFDLARQHQQAGRLREAEQCCQQVLALEPGHAEAIYLLGIIAHQTGSNDIAVDLLRRAIARNPNLPEAYIGLGVALHAKGRIDDGIAAFRQAIALKPDYAQAYTNLGIALKDKGEFDEAVAAHRRAIAFDPNLWGAYNNLGNALRGKGQLDEAIAAFRQAIALKPNHVQAYSNLGNALKDKRKFDEAIAAHRQAISVGPKVAEAHSNLGNVLKDIGQLDEAIAAFRQALLLNPDRSIIHSNLLYSLHFHPDLDALSLLEAHRQWDQRHAQRLQKEIRPAQTDASSNRRVRVGYVSPDLCAHVVGRHVLPLLANHDRKQFEIFCYTGVRKADSFTQRLREHTDQWRTTVGLSDTQLADLVRSDRIDILVDLTLHMAGSRLLAFARKPAPIQMTYLGYCSTTGLGAMDYRISDPYLDPPGMDIHYVEQTIRVPRTYWCYQPRDGAPEVAPLPARQAGCITFGCLNNFSKISIPALRLWSGLLANVPGSRLLIHSGEGLHRGQTVQRLGELGVGADRIQFFAGGGWEEYMRVYNRIDIALDPFPYGGGITTCDGLWMGVPVVTLIGRTAVGRGGASILSNLGLTELIASTLEQYMRIATDLAKDWDRLDALRRGMRARMLNSPLMDAPGFARDIEAAYRQVWKTWCEAGPVNGAV